VIRGQGYSVRILLDSIGPSGCRLTTWELRYPRMVHAELMTHRLLSRNSASSRAIPIAKMIAQVWRDPAMPVWWGANQSGMQARAELSGVRMWLAHRTWLAARLVAIVLAWMLSRVGLHKQIANRLLEPWMFITVIVSATEFANWFALRDHPDAQPEIAWVARLMHERYRDSDPYALAAGEWHMPLLDDKEREHIDIDDRFTLADARKVSVGRCARVSYLTHDGKRDLAADVALHDRLAGSSPGHWSPFEHVAQALPDATPSGNFRGWKQYRKTFAAEHVGGPRA
jgi:hypothetical protein